MRAVEPGVGHTSHEPDTAIRSRYDFESWTLRRAALGLWLFAFEVSEDMVDHLVIDDEGDDEHLGAAVGTQQWVDLVQTLDHLRPTSAERERFG